MHMAESKVCESGGQEASKSPEGITLANILVFGLRRWWFNEDSGSSDLLGPRATRPQTRRRREVSAMSRIYVFALRAHCGRVARGPSKSLEPESSLNHHRRSPNTRMFASVIPSGDLDASCPPDSQTLDSAICIQLPTLSQRCANISVSTTSAKASAK